MQISSNPKDEIEGWSNSIENPLRASSTYQRKPDHGFTHESYTSARHYGMVEKPLGDSTQCSGVMFKVIEMMITLLLIGALLTTWSIPNEGDADLPDLHSASAQMTQPWEETNPWPGKAYMIIEKTSRRAITVQNGELFLQALDHPDQEVTQTRHNTWLCCEENNYWAFQNVPTGRYIGHDGGNGMRVGASRIQNWEMMVARPLASGGYQLLMPHYWHTLQMIAIAQDGRHLTRQIDGGAVWEFRMVQPR